jgi:hypothetical protein
VACAAAIAVAAREASARTAAMARRDMWLLQGGVEDGGSRHIEAVFCGFPTRAGTIAGRSRCNP